MRPDFVARVEDALCNPGRYLWLPGLAEELANLGWSSLRSNFGICSSNYGTGRVLGRSANTPRKIVARVQFAIAAEPLNHVPQVEILDGDAARGYEDSNVRFYTEEEIRELNLCGRLEEAINLLEFVPSLREVVVIMVKSIHLIDASHDDYDVSFSEPRLPFSIFLSVPHSHNFNVALRVAEGLIHEAMHLQLSLVERVVALIRSEKHYYFSPWRNELRSSRGVLHALYVFRVIDSFFGELLGHRSLSLKQNAYVQDRRRQIHKQINEVRDFTTSPELTKVGKTFVNKLMGAAGVITA